MYCIYVPIGKPEILNKNEERLSLTCFQTIIEHSSSCLYFLHNGEDGQLKLIRNDCKKKQITINTNKKTFEIEKKTTIILIYISKNKSWNLIYET